MIWEHIATLNKFRFAVPDGLHPRALQGFDVISELLPTIFENSWGHVMFWETGGQANGNGAETNLCNYQQINLMVIP